jgi:hypothetical protein
MPRGLVFPFPSPSGLTEDDLDRMRRFTAAIPGAQIDILAGRSRRTSAFLALAGRQLRVERNGEVISIHNASSGPPSGQNTGSDDLLAAIQAALSATEEPRRPPAVSIG